MEKENMTEFEQQYTQQAEILNAQLTGVLCNKKIPGALVEAGNFYGGEAIRSDHILGLQIGMYVAELLESMGIATRRAILIDFYHHGGQSASLDHVEFASNIGFTPDLVFYEHEYLSEANVLIQKLLQNRRAKQNGAGKVRYKADVLKEPDGVVSCAAFEVPIHIDKAKENPDGVCVTVLPSIYKSQQHLVQALLNEVQQEIPTVVVYFDDKGQTELETYNFGFLDY